jgi:hypothetical protein
MKPLNVCATLFAAGLCLVFAGPAAAQFGTGFEPNEYQGSSDGVVLTGQQGWYIPPPPVGGNDFFVFTYDTNALLLPDNPNGETQFIGSERLASNYSRAQLDFDWSQSTVWTVSYDICARWDGTGPPVNNLSSFSLQDSAVNRSFVAVNTWADMVGNSWMANYQIYNAAGQQQQFQLAGPEWNNLAVDHWYNQSTTFDLNQNLILSVSITDLDTGDSATVNPDSWYLLGGANPTQPLPTALRFFVGGDGTPPNGNVMGFDNLEITPGGNEPVRGDPTKSVTVPTDFSAVID